MYVLENTWEVGVSATKNKYSPGSDNIAASIELFDENDIDEEK